jgi:sulfate permease, SulP family
VLDASAMVAIDATGAHTLHALREDLEEAGVDLHLATVRSPVRDTLQRAGVWDDITRGHDHADLDEAVDCASGAADGPEPTEQRSPLWTS